MIKSFIKKDLFYFIKSKQIFVFVFIVALIFGFDIFCNYAAAKDHYDSYTRVYQNCLDSDMDIEELMSEDYEIETNEIGSGKQTLITNPLPYYYDKTIESVLSLHPFFLLGTIYAPVTAIAALFVSVMGVMAVNDDIVHLTVKFYVVKYGKIKYMLLKMLGVLIRSLLVIIISTLIAFVLDIPFFLAAKNDIPLEIPVVNINDISLSATLKQILFALFVFALYALLGAFIGVLTRNTLVSSALFWVISLMPFDLKYLPGCIVNSIAKDIYTFNGNFVSVSADIECNYLSYCIIIVLPVISVISAVMVFKKRSSYIS